ncbi:MAG: methylamine utilization protein [Vicinamibacterales bacterium]
MRTLVWPVLAVAAGLAAPAGARADVLSGTVATKVREGLTPGPAVVYAEPASGAAPAAPPRTVTVSQKNKTFLPRVVGVPVGGVVRFPNDDQIFHNVFSLTPGHAFDLGLYRAGQSKNRTIGAPGLVRVFCNIHPQMTALIVAAATPWITTAAADGSWRLELPPGRYRLTAVSERAAPVVREVEVAGLTTAPRLELDESDYVGVRHLNKFGQPYSEAAYKEP